MNSQLAKPRIIGIEGLVGFGDESLTLLFEVERPVSPNHSGSSRHLQSPQEALFRRLSIHRRLVEIWQVLVNLRA